MTALIIRPNQIDFITSQSRDARGKFGRENSMNVFYEFIVKKKGRRVQGLPSLLTLTRLKINFHFPLKDFVLFRNETESVVSFYLTQSNFISDFLFCVLSLYHLMASLKFAE